MPTPCEFVTKCAVYSYDKRGDAVVSIGTDLVDNEPEYFVLICVRDCAGCQHVRTRGATALMLMERIMRGCRLIFDRVVAVNP